MNDGYCVAFGMYLFAEIVCVCVLCGVWLLCIVCRDVCSYLQSEYLNVFCVWLYCGVCGCVVC